MSMEEPEPLLLSLDDDLAVVAQLVPGASGPVAAGAPPWALERESFTRRVQSLEPTLRRICTALTRDPTEAEDLLQNAMLKAYLHRGSFQGRSPLVGWLYGIIRHEHDEAARSKARRWALLSAEQARFGEALGACGPASGHTPEDRLCLAEDAGRVRTLLGELPEEFRTVVVLCDLEGLTHEQAAGRLKVPVGTIKSRHARGRARLREALAGA